MNYSFKPKLLPTIGAILLTLVFCLLGRWQLHRYAEKQHFQDTFNARSHLPPRSLSSLADTSDVNDFPLILKGHYLQQHFLLDNQIQQGKLGYQVLTVFQPEKSSQQILINRGWISLGASRQTIPIFKTPTDLALTINGLAKIPSQMFSLNNNIESLSPAVRRIETINIVQLSDILHKPLYPFIMLLDKEQPSAFVCDWAPNNIHPEKSLGYAIQWFSFAVVLIIIYFVLSRGKTS